MLLETFNTIEGALTNELREALEHAEDIGQITADEHAELWFDKGRGMAWLNEGGK